MPVPQGHTGMTFSYDKETAKNLAVIVKWHEEIDGMKMSKSKAIRWAIAEMAQKISEAEQSHE